MMAGSAPFSEPNILEKHLRAIPESLAKVAAYVNKDLAAFIMRMLQKDPKSRPQDMTELLTLLKQIDSAPITSEIKDISRRKKQIQMDEIEEEPQEKLSSSQESEQMLIATRKKHLGVDEDKKAPTAVNLFEPITDEEYKQQLAAFSDNYQELRGKFDFEQDTKTDID
jgi:serine/threonine protein kinase